MTLKSAQIASLESLVSNGISFPEAVAQSIGGTDVCNELWRFYSDLWPTGGVKHWNEKSLWQQHWRELLPKGAFTFGEDVFGNQLIVFPGHENVHLLSHENAELVDLYCGPASLLNTILKNGIDWIDFYGDGSLTLARKYVPVARDSHLHWTTPLILGGAVTDANISTVDRENHLVGHAKLWSQIRGMSPGTIIMPK